MTTLTPEIDYEALGRPLQGPQALSGDWKRFCYLTFNIAKTNWKMRFFGSVLGVVWQVIRPLMLFGVLYVFFTKVAKVGSGADTGPGQANHFYGTQLLGAIVLFTYLQEATIGSVRCIVDNEVLVRKIDFPRMVIPLSAVLLSTFNVALNMVVVLVFALVEGVRPTVGWLEVPVIVLLIGLFAVGLSMLLASAFVYFRDVQPIWDVVMQVWFYSSGVMIPIVSVATQLAHNYQYQKQYEPTTLMRLYLANPMTALLQQYKHAVEKGSYGASFWSGGSEWLLIPFAIIAICLVAGLWVFNRTAPYVAENL